MYLTGSSDPSAHMLSGGHHDPGPRRPRVLVMYTKMNTFVGAQSAGPARAGHAVRLSCLPRRHIHVKMYALKRDGRGGRDLIPHVRAGQRPAVGGFYIVNRYDDLGTVLEDPQTYSSEQAGLRGVPIKMPPLTEDPPRHLEYRRLLNRYLSRSFLSQYADDIRETARELLEKLIP